MPNRIKFVAKSQRIKAEQAAAARQAFLSLSLPQHVLEEVLIVIQRHETGGVTANWRFNMFSPQQCLMIWRAIKQLEKPLITRDVFDLVLTHIEPNTGLVTLTREEIAQTAEIKPQEVSRAMTRLENLGAITRERVKIPGLKGPGMVRYRINPNVGWNGKLEKREVLAQTAPTELRVVAGKDFPASSGECD